MWSGVNVPNSAADYERERRSSRLANEAWLIDATQRRAQVLDAWIRGQNGFLEARLDVLPEYPAQRAFACHLAGLDEDFPVPIELLQGSGDASPEDIRFTDLSKVKGYKANHHSDATNGVNELLRNLKKWEVGWRKLGEGYRDPKLMADIIGAAEKIPIFGQILSVLNIFRKKIQKAANRKEEANAREVAQTMRDQIEYLTTTVLPTIAQYTPGEFNAKVDQDILNSLAERQRRIDAQSQGGDQLVLPLSTKQPEAPTPIERMVHHAWFMRDVMQFVPGGIMPWQANNKPIYAQI